MISDVKTLQEKWQKKWAKEKIFQSEVDKSKKKFFITTPYPYISGSLHIGHARAVTEVDVYTRYKRMAGFNTLYPMAFHISGTPVLGISLAIKKGDKKKIALYKEYVKAYVKEKKEVDRIIKSFEEPQNIVDFFIPLMKQEYATLGLSVDWTRSFTSGDILHQKMVEWLFKKYKEKNYLVQGSYPVLYSLSLENAVGEDDIKDGDTDAVEKKEFTLIKFGYEDGFLVAATLRPETMYGQTNMWVNPTTTYVKAQVDDEIWYCSKECVEKLSYQEHKVKVLQEIPGTDFIGKNCKAPFINKNIPIFPAPFCNPDIGTGMVTSVPSHAPFDYLALKELQEDKKRCEKYGLNHEDVKNLAIVPILKTPKYGLEAGKKICEKMGITSISQEDKLREALHEVYKTEHHTGVLLDNCEQFSRMKVPDAIEAMKKYLLEKKEGVLFWEVSRPAISRDGGKVIVAILDKQWFIDFNAKGWKKEAQSCLEKMNIVPNKYRKRFEDTFSWLDKRPCARKRGLGTKLPFDKNWVIESLSDSVIYMTLYPIAQLVKEYKLGEKELTEEFFDYVYNGKGTVGLIAKETGISIEKVEKIRTSFDYWYPNDHRHTFEPHLSNHLTFLIFAHAAALNKKYWPKKISFHGMIFSEGMKMSKSKGNVVTLLDMGREHGADVFRSFLCTATSVEGSLNWEADKVHHLHKHLNNLYEILEDISKNKKKGTLSDSHAWFTSQFERAKKEATEALERMDLRSYAMIALYRILTMYKKIAKMVDAETMKLVHHTIIQDWITLLAPVTPHLAEELWQKNKETGLVSVAPWVHYDEKKISLDAEQSAELVDTTIGDIRSVIKLAKLDKAKNTTLFIASQWKYDLFTEVRKELNNKSSGNDIVKKMMSKNTFKKHGQELMKFLPARLKQHKIPEHIGSQDKEEKILTEAQSFIEKELGLTIKIITAEKSTHQKSKQAMPGKVAIVVE